MVNACVTTPVISPDEAPNAAYVLPIPEGFPYPYIPSDNALTQNRIELGRKLFFDPILSRDSSISCASCHLPSAAFSDTLAVSLGVEQRAGTRNSPTLANVAYHPYYLREGGVPTLEMQILVPVQEHNEFDFNMLLLSERLNTDSNYVTMAQNAYQRTPDPFVITRAIAAFQRTLISGNSRFDRYIYQGQTSALNTTELHGFELFKTWGCTNCHNGFNFTNYSFQNTGLYEVYNDIGRERLTLDSADRAKFKVPSLRNVGLTPPYMHDGSMATLSEIVDHYASGGKNHPNKSMHITGFELNPSDKQAIIAFLHSLSDYTFINNPNFAAPNN